MNRIVYTYDLSFRKKGSELTLKKEYISFEELDEFLEWLKNCNAVFWENGLLILWIDDLTHLKIIKKNYIKYDWRNYGQQIITVEETEHLEQETVEVDIDEWITWDITREMLIKYNIRWWYYKRIWKVVLEENKLYVDNKLISKLDQEKKPIELMRLILETESIHKRNNFTYEELKEFYNQSTLPFNELTRADLNNIWVREIIGKKIKSSKDIANIEFIEIHSDFIALWKEKET